VSPRMVSVGAEDIVCSLLLILPLFANVGFFSYFKIEIDTN
jgi:hypothetical protein